MLDKIIKIAKLAHSGASVQAIASVFNLDESVILAVKEQAEYKIELSRIQENSFDKAQTLDGGWDRVEEQGMLQVLDHLEKVPDPDFALKAIALANKAIRRNGNQANRLNTPIEVNNNLQAVILVQPQFAKAMKEGYLIDDVKQPTFVKKITNAMNPSAVKNLLGRNLNDKMQTGEVNEILSDLDNIAEAILI